LIHWGHWMVLGSHERFSYGLFSFARTFYHNMRISFPCTRTVVTNQDPKLTFWQNYAYAYGPFSSRMYLYLSEQADHFVKRARTSFPPFYLRAFPVSRAVRPFLFHLKSGGGAKDTPAPFQKVGGGIVPAGPFTLQWRRHWFWPHFLFIFVANTYNPAFYCHIRL